MSETPTEVNDRHKSPYSRNEKIGRLLWMIVQRTLFRYSWITSYGYRRTLLRLFGAKISPTARVRRNLRLECPWNLTLGENTVIGERAVLYCLGPVTVGDRVTISQHVHVCAGSHDYKDRLMLPLLRPPITIEDDVWVAADAFVGPGVTLGRGVILGARGVAVRDLAPWGVYGGNPAKKIADRPHDDQPPAAPEAATPAPATDTPGTNE